MTAVVMRMIHGQKWHLVNEKRSHQQKLLHERGRAVRFLFILCLDTFRLQSCTGGPKVSVEYEQEMESAPISRTELANW